MSTATLNLAREQVQQLIDFCTKHNLTEWFIAKDHGAYIGAVAGAAPAPKCIFYFPGCDPAKDADWYDTALAQFGGDDFGELLPVADLVENLLPPEVIGLRFVVAPTEISIIQLVRKQTTEKE